MTKIIDTPDLCHLNLPAVFEILEGVVSNSNTMDKMSNVYSP